MALKAALSKDEYDKLEESLKKFYVEKGGKYLLDAEGVEDVSGLKSALDKERESVKALKRELQETADKYKDIDPEKAREALTKLQQLGDKELLDKGKFNELLEAQTKRMRDDYEAKVTASEKKAKEATTENERLTGRLERVTIQTQLRDAAMSPEVGVLPTAISDLILRAHGVWALDKDGKAVAMNGDQVIRGKDGVSPMSFVEWIVGLRPEAPHLFGQSSGGGSNQDKGGKPGSNKKRSEMSPKERADYITAHGQEKYLELAT